MPLEFSRDLWKQIRTREDVRAEYLRNLVHLPGDESTYRYLDIGCGSGVNALYIGNGLKEIHCLDIRLSGELRKKRGNNLFLYMGDAQALPFRNESFDLVSMISVVEHLRNKSLAIREASRVLKRGGTMILQVPNRFFPLELHTGLPFIYYFPRRLRNWIWRGLGYGRRSYTEIPSRRYLMERIRSMDSCDIRVSKVVYPIELILPRFNSIFSLLKSLGAFDLVPFGWLFLWTKRDERTTHQG